MTLTHPFLRKMFDEKLLRNTGRALDLGCGGGVDAQELAELGYAVDAVEKDEKYSEALSKLAQNLSVSVHLAAIETFPIHPSTYSVIIANNSLPFISEKKCVKDILRKSVAGLTENGVLYFTLFGPKDAWASKNGMSFFAYDEALAFLQTLPVSVYHRSTEEGYGKTMKDEIKYWHIHRFFCMKK